MPRCFIASSPNRSSSANTPASTARFASRCHALVQAAAPLTAYDAMTRRVCPRLGALGSDGRCTRLSCAQRDCGIPYCPQSRGPRHDQMRRTLAPVGSQPTPEARGRRSRSRAADVAPGTAAESRPFRAVRAGRGGRAGQWVGAELPPYQVAPCANGAQTLDIPAAVVPICWRCRNAMSLPVNGMARERARSARRLHALSKALFQCSRVVAGLSRSCHLLLAGTVKTCQ